jgi:hypothetical protein
MIETQQGPAGPRHRSWFVLLLLVGLVAALAAVPGLANTNPKPTDVPAKVIAHLPLDAASGNQMILQKLGTKHYLYIQQASKQSYTVVEVTKPEFPTVVKPHAPGDATAGKLEMVDGNMAVAAVPDVTAKTAIRSTPTTQTVRILDVSDPEHPTTLQTFQNVTSLLADGSRGVIFLTNDEGLWVLKHNRAPFTVAKTKKPCDSYSAIAAMPPDCQ